MAADEIHEVATAQLAAEMLVALDDDRLATPCMTVDAISSPVKGRLRSSNLHEYQRRQAPVI
jgi:hypothetical protein